MLISCVVSINKTQRFLIITRIGLNRNLLIKFRRTAGLMRINLDAKVISKQFSDATSVPILLSQALVSSRVWKIHYQQSSTWYVTLSRVKDDK